jgi:hypothetical protein
MTILYLVQLVFSVWMLVDAVKRRALFYWYIVLFVPFGPLVYFFAVKINDYELRWLRDVVAPKERPPTIEELRAELRKSPSFANRMRLANALHDAGQYADAARSFEIVLESRGDEPDALYGLGRCRMELGEPEAAVEPLSKLIAKNRAYRDYAACLELAEAFSKSGRDDDAIDLLEALVRQSPRPRHSVALADCLVAASRVEEAQQVLRDALADHESSSPAIKKRDRETAREAAALLKAISSKS